MPKPGCDARSGYRQRLDAHARDIDPCSLKVDHADAMWQHWLGRLPTAPSGDETIALRRPL
jgi:hypothetical protein